MRTYLDADLLAYGEVFAAAGTPNAIFEADPARLAEVCGAAVIAVHD
jgi:prolyl-tRNA editing enzyme YbaK/EbsC (Cys-tRNA(Pro) deacylase)